MRTLLVSTYEMGHQPLGLAAPAAALRAAGHEVDCFDLAVETPEAERFAAAELIGISVPMHTASRLAIDLAERLRRLNPAAHIAFYGLYASTLHERLTAPSVPVEGERRALADSVIGGEYEPALVALADALADRLAGRRNGDLHIEGLGASPAFSRQQYPVPDRRGLPPLDQYAALDAGDGSAPRLAGYVETTRGCAHTCTHCPITPVYGGRLRLVQAESVLADVAQLVDAGARHITFGDPDFLNAVPHSLGIAEQLHARWPDVSFDATIKVEHLLEHEALLPRLRELGCLFVTSAFESTNDRVLRLLEKGHTLDDMERAVTLAERAGLTLRPTWVAFTPWTALDDFRDLLDFVERHGLVANVQPVQYGLRLLLPPGSPLNATLEAEGRLGPFDDAGLSYTWAAEDARVDALQRRLSALVEEHARDRDCSGGGPSYPESFGEVKRLTAEALGGSPVAAEAIEVAAQPRRAVPGLTESWFC